MIILYQNLVEGAGISALTENPDYIFDTAFNDDRLSRVGRTVADEDQTFTFDLLSAVAVDKVLIQDHNLTSGATILLEGNVTDVWTAPAYTMSISYNETYIYKDLVNAETYRYWRLSVDDASNPDGYIEISKVFLGQGLEMPPINTGVAIPHKSNSSSSKSTSGQLYSNRQLQYKAAAITLSNITESQRQQIKTWWNYVDVVKPFWILLWEDSLDVEPPIYCNLTEEIELTKDVAEGNTWSLNLKFEECF